MKKKLIDILINCPDHIKANMSRKNYPAEAIILTQGEYPDFVQIIQQGKVKVYNISGKGQKYLKCFLGPGDILGDIEIISDVPYISYVESVEPCTMINFSRPVYLNWLQHDHDFSLFIIEHLSRKLYKSSQTANLNVLYPLKYGLLKRFYHLYHKNTQSNEIAVSKSDLADNLGTSVRSLNRILKELVEDDIIVVQRNKITIASIDGLVEEIDKYE